MRKLVIGIDVSKRTLDVHVKPTGTTLQISNDLAGFRTLKKQVISVQETIIVMEHTGLYSRQLELFLSHEGISFCKVSALEIKRSIGVKRGKSDRVDAMHIADYGWLRKERLVTTEIISAEMEQLTNLLSLRSKLVKDRGGYKARLKELKNAAGTSIDKTLLKSHQNILRSFDKEIEMIEKQIRVLIQANQQYRESFQLLTSIRGVGEIIAIKMIITTNNFTRFSNARKFNCYAGLAPFKNESGTSIRGRARVSHLANKEIKTVLNMGAFSAIRCNPELKQYYDRRVNEGKSKMACINIIRSKIVARMFAVIKKQQPYKNFLSAA